MRPSEVGRARSSGKRSVYAELRPRKSRARRIDGTANRSSYCDAHTIEQLMQDGRMAAGYSGTPLPKKLGVKEGSRVVVVGAPAGFDLGVPVGRKGTQVDVLVAFVKQRAVLAGKLAAWRAQLAQNGGLWIAWPKKSSRVATDITEDTIRDVALPTGLVDNKVCAIDDTWSGLRLVIRKELRT